MKNHVKIVTSTSGVSLTHKFSDVAAVLGRKRWLPTERVGRSLSRYLRLIPLQASFYKDTVQIRVPAKEQTKHVCRT